MSTDTESRLPDWALQRATADVLADVDSIANWLACECAFTGRVSSDWESRVAGRMEEAATSTLLHAAMVAADRGDAATCCEAMGLLVKTGHRDARHAAAELALQYDALIEQMAAALERVTTNYLLTLAGKPVRDVSETLAECSVALAAHAKVAKS
jgi:hypothetical protein